MYLDRDIIRVQSGELFTIYGNYQLNKCIARLSYIPDQSGDRLFEGIPYRKIKSQRVEHPNELTIFSDMDGEQQYIISSEQIISHFSPLQNSRYQGEMHQKRIEFEEHLRKKISDDIRVGFTGSGLLGIMQNGSDYDWIIYSSSQLVDDILQSIFSHPKFEFKNWLDMDGLCKKYSNLKNLTNDDIRKMYVGKKRFGNLFGVNSSFLFVNPNRFYDTYIYPDIICKEYSFSGEISNWQESYFVPSSLIAISKSGISTNLLIWPNLYYAFISPSKDQKSILVEGVGELIDVKGTEYVRIYNHNHYIKLIE